MDMPLQQFENISALLPKNVFGSTDTPFEGIEKQKMKKSSEKIQVFAELGFGNATFLSTEVEKGAREKRMAKFIIPPRIKGVYIRIWVYKYVIAFSTNRFINWQKKHKTNFKFIFGIEGYR